ncbi:MAG TPA: outer membrane beta-barrel protein [Vicinamibacterales bacterium]|nr:outer membrane beta-barrel protein [Vicinamibacterales bacterium]
MRRAFLTMAFVCTLALPAAARAQNAQIQGFGGLTFGDVTSSTTFGGGIAVPLGDNLQVIAEGGRMTDVLPSLPAALIDFTPIDFGVSAYYGEAGIRVLAPSHRAVRPYGEATAGFARLRGTLDGTGVDGIVNTALGLFDRNEPMLGVGGGVIVQGGPVFVDLGYRYKKIYASDSLQALLTGGDFHVNQLRVGVGVRF